MQGRLHEALEYYHRALQSDTDYFDARVNLAAALRTLSRQKEALSELQIVFAKSPNHVGALFQRANLLADDRRIAEAEQIFQLIRIRQQRPYDLRHSLQDRFARSTLGNPSAFAKEIEAAYDTAWSSAVTGHRRIGG